MNYSAPSARGIPLRPDAGALLADQRRSLHRALAAKVLGVTTREPAHRIVERVWGDDYRAALIVKAPSAPTTAAGSPLSQTRVGDLLLIAPGSAAAQLFQRCLRLDFDGGVSQYLVPYIGTHPTPLFVAEGSPVPVVQGVFGHAALGPVKKLIFITTVSNELMQATPESAAIIIGRLLGEGAAKSLDAAVFGNAAADATRPAGLLNGVSAIPEVTGSGTSIDQAAADIASFAAAFSAANINSANMVLIMHPQQAWKLRMVLGYQNLDLLVLSSIALAPGTVVAVVPSAIASGYEGASEIELTQTPTLHFDDSVPLELVNAAGTVAAPARNTFQEDLTAIRLKIKCAWAALQPGAVQYMVSVNW